jgi:hypothetical protein
VAFHPIETFKRIPWEIWAGLVVTIAVAWILMRSQGRTVVQPAPTETPPDQAKAVTAGPASSTDVGTLSQQIADLTKANQDLTNSLLAGHAAGNPAAQDSLISAHGVNPEQGWRQVSQAQPYNPGGGLIATGTSLQRGYQSGASSSSGLAGGGGGGAGVSSPVTIPAGSGPGGGYDFLRSVAVDIGTHSATDASGNTYTISKPYAAMTDAEKDDANRFARGS